jgi:ABC-type transport system involved in multi-copper enzyme maturation permease subunit
MTAPTVTPYRSDAPAGRDGFAQLLRAEWTKFRTVRGWVIGAVVAALVMLGLGFFVALGTKGSCVAESGSGSGSARSGSACTPKFPTGPGGGPVTDSFYFVRQPLAGNGSITVRVTSLTGLLPVFNNSPAGPGQQFPARPGLVPWAKAGLIIKDGTAAGSAYAAIMITADHGVRMQADYTQDTAGLPGAVTAASPRWLRLTRSGDTITGYDAADGTHWTQVAQVTLAGLPTVTDAGLFAASPIYQSITQGFGGSSNGSEAPSTATAAFDHLGLQGRWPAAAWTGSYIGADNGPGIGQYHQAGGRFTVSGSGDIAPIVSGPSGPGGPSLTLANLLIGTFAALIAVIVVATLFITAEYRRGLIRTTLAASPRRGRVLAAKAVVVGSVGFVTGLVAAAAVIILGGQVARHHAYVFPASWATELRVLVGTGALVALVAVLALAVGAMLRRSAAAVTTVILAIVATDVLGLILPVGAADWLLRLTPAAAFALQQTSPAYPQVNAIYSPVGGYYPLAPWAGLAVLAGYAALALAAAVVQLRKRDA